MSTRPRPRPPRFALVGGGTGGHIYPALAVAEELRRLSPGSPLLFIGGDRMERTVVPEAGLPFRGISVHGLAGRGLAAWARRLRSVTELAIGLPLWQSLIILRQFRPDVVIGTGGYVCGPVLLAARLLRCPAIALEGNRTPGLTTRLICRLVPVMAVAWPELVSYFQERVGSQTRVVLTGFPVRPSVLAPGRAQAAAALGLDPARPVLLVLGGSLGSQRINETLCTALLVLARSQPRARELQVLHVIGPGRQPPTPAAEMQAAIPGYRAISYLRDDYPHALAAADLVIARAGASTIAELLARRLPAVLIPWAAASSGEQVQNAEPLARHGAAVVIPEAELTAESLARLVAELLWNGERRELMAQAAALLGRPDAATRVAQLALELAGRGDQSSGGRSA